MRLVGATPERYVGGLGAVVLTNLDAMNREQRRRKSRWRGRQVSVAQLLGRYHPAWNGAQAWIEIFVDQVFKDCPRWVQWVPPIRELLLADTLYHEIGHHVHRTQKPEYTEKESVADRWQRRLSAQYWRRQYWYLMPLAMLVYPVGRMATWVYKWTGKVTKRITTA